MHASVLSITISVLVVAIASNAHGVDRPSVKVNYTFETSVEASALFAKGGAVYVHDLETFESYTQVRLCGGLSGGGGAGTYGSGACVLCVNIRIPGNVDEKTALTIAQEELANKSFWERIRAEDWRLERLEKALAGKRLSTPTDPQLDRIERMLERIGRK